MYLDRRVSMLNVILQVTHEHEVPSLVPAAVQRVVVDVAQDGARADAVGSVLGVDELAQAVHEDSAVLTFALFLVLFRLGKEGELMLDK